MPGSANDGVTIRIAVNLNTICIEQPNRLEKYAANGPSTTLWSTGKKQENYNIYLPAWMSCANRTMIRDVGVVSSHLRIILSCVPTIGKEGHTAKYFREQSEPVCHVFF